MNFLNETLIILANVLVGIVLHECGHYLVANANGLNPKFGIDKSGFFVFYDDCDNELRKSIILTGVFFGFIPFLWMGIFLNVYYAMAFAAVMIMGSIKDLENWRRLN